MTTSKELRRQAEEINRERALQTPQDQEALTPEAVQQALHELRVHQIELEMQNEELQRTQAELEESRARYFDLYDLAPVGYLTLSAEGNILEGNLASANVLGVTRGALAGRPLSQFILPEDQDTFYLKRRLLEQSGKQQACHLRIKTWGNAPFWGHMAMSVTQQVDGSPQYRVILSDITERVAAEAALRRSEKDLRESQRVAHVGSWRLNLATQEVVWTDELYSMYGFDPSLPPPPYSEYMKLFTPESWERLSTALSHTMEIGIPYTLELQTIRNDGSNGWIWMHGQADVDSTGKIVGLWGGAQDITERKLAEEVLKISEEKYRTLFNGMLDGFVLLEMIYDDQGNPVDYRHIEVNPAYEALTGLKTELVTGRTIKEVIPDVEDFWIVTYGRVDKTGISEHIEQYSKPLDRWFSVSAYQPALGFVAVIFENITERRQAEQALRESVAKLRATIAQSIDGILIADQDSRIIEWNDAQVAIYGHSREEMLGKPMWEFQASLLPDELRTPAMMAQLENSMRSFQHSGTSAWTQAPQEILVQVADGQSKTIEVSLFPIRAQDTTLWGAISRDITERKRAQEAQRESEARELRTKLSEQQQRLESARKAADELRQKADELALSNRDLQQFAYVASHDLQEPLRMVASYTQLLAERYQGQLDDKADKYIAYAVEGAIRMQQLLKDLLAFSRLTTRANPFTET
ncbi:MAG: PAS domain-containing sensor histidine kinase, partial [Anaerolineae bacterium]